MPDELTEFVDRVAQIARETPALSKKVDEAKWYAGLKEDPGWQRLARKVLEDNDSWLAGITKRQFRGEAVSQREIDQQRGFVLGALFTIRYPEIAEQGLEQAGRIAWRKALEEQDQLEEESPYA